MTSTAGAGRTREPGEIFFKQLLDAESIDDAGYVLKHLVESTVDKVGKAAAGDIPYAVNYRSTRDPHDMNFPATINLIGSDIGEKGIAVLRDGWAKLKVADNNVAIVIGDPLEVDSTGGGKVDKHVPTVIGNTSVGDESSNIDERFKELSLVVGNAEEDVAAGSSMAPGQDKVLTHLTIGNVGLIPA